MNDEDDGPDLIGTVCEYDRMRRRLNRELRKRVVELEAEVKRLQDEAFANAQANSRALFDGIMSGAISKPLTREEKVKRLRAIFHAGMTCEGRCDTPLTDDELLAEWEQV